MITRCDHCGSKFEVSAELVYSSDPGVRCGECMSLFDARANLYNEADFRQTSSVRKPVQTTRSARVSDASDLETADTIASEHFYASAGGRSRVREGLGVDSSDSAGASAYSSEPDGNLPPPYRPHDNYPAELEFERTLATESSLPDAGFRPVASGNGVGGKDASVKDEQREELTAEELTRRKQQLMREREQRALDIEPERDFDAVRVTDPTLDAERTAAGARGFDRQQRRQVEEFRARDGEMTRSRNDNRDLAAGARSRTSSNPAAGSSPRVRRSDHEFIPDNVLKKSAVYRDNGRREENMQFNPDTPKFATTPEAPAGSRTRQPIDDSSEFQHLHDRAVDDLAIRDERPVVAGTSAQEMRRYQHYRPAVELSDEKDLVAERRPVVKNQKRSALGAALWLLGLIAAVGLLMFAARSIIANMNLPEPVITGFCQITGCVPGEAKKDVSQLQTMRKRLYSHPEIEDALVISVDLVNNSVYKQPYPTLAVTLMDVNGASVAERAFTSTDYEVVDGGESGFLMPGEPTRMKIEVIDTGLGATDVDLDFE